MRTTVKCDVETLQFDEDMKETDRIKAAKEYRLNEGDTGRQTEKLFLPYIIPWHNNIHRRRITPIKEQGARSEPIAATLQMTFIGYVRGDDLHIVPN